MKRSTRTSRSQLLLIGTLAILAAVAAVALAQPHAGPAKSTHAAAPATAGVTEAGMRAYIDPETGQLGTSSALPPLTDQEKALLEPAQAPREVVLPDGSVMIELNGACQEFTVMHLDADGNRSVQCVQDPQKALQSPAPAAKPEGR